MSHGGHSDEEKKANFLAKKMRLKPRHRYPTSSCRVNNGFPRKLLWFGIVGTKGHKITTRWASTQL